VRWTYNKLIEGLINLEINQWYTHVSKEGLRNYCVNSLAFEQGGPLYGRLRPRRRKIGPDQELCNFDCGVKEEKNPSKRKAEEPKREKRKRAKTNIAMTHAPW
jgi:hypothetical protein